MSVTPADRVAAVIWDFDGTLVDTRAKNIAVNRRIIEAVTGRPWTGLPEATPRKASGTCVSQR